MRYKVVNIKKTDNHPAAKFVEDEEDLFVFDDYENFIVADEFFNFKGEMEFTDKEKETILSYEKVGELAVVTIKGIGSIEKNERVFTINEDIVVHGSKKHEYLVELFNCIDSIESLGGE